MDKQLKQSIKTAAVNREMIVVWLHGGGKAKGIPEVSADPDRVKINTIEGPVWVPYVDMKVFHQSLDCGLKVKQMNKPSPN